MWLILCSPRWWQTPGSLTKVSSASVQKGNVFLTTSLHSPVGALPDDVVLEVGPATEGTGRYRPRQVSAAGIVLKLGVLPQVTAMHMLVPEDPEPGSAGDNSDTTNSAQVVYRCNHSCGTTANMTGRGNLCTSRVPL